MPLRKILFVGMPGSGKGTQAKLLIPFGFKHINTGDLIRDAWERKDSLVMPYKSHIEGGGFLPDKEIFELIDKEIKGLGEVKGYILDGAIRNLAQAETALQGSLLEGILFFELSEEESRKRLRKRSRIEGRKDDSPKIVTRRLEKYRKETEPVINYLSERKIPVYRIDASLSIEEIHAEVLRVLGLDG